MIGIPRPMLESRGRHTHGPTRRAAIGNTSNMGRLVGSIIGQMDMFWRRHPARHPRSHWQLDAGPRRRQRWPRRRAAPSQGPGMEHRLLGAAVAFLRANLGDDATLDLETIALQAPHLATLAQPGVRERGHNAHAVAVAAAVWRRATGRSRKGASRTSLKPRSATAWESPSHFSRAFRKAFGRSPSSLASAETCSVSGAHRAPPPSRSCPLQHGPPGPDSHKSAGDLRIRALSAAMSTATAL